MLVFNNFQTLYVILGVLPVRVLHISPAQLSSAVGDNRRIVNVIYLMWKMVSAKIKEIKDKVLSYSVKSLKSKF